MAATANYQAFGTPTQLACTIASLASTSTRESASVAVGSALDYMITLTFTITSGSPSTTGPYVNIYANGSPDGTLWPIIMLSSAAPKATSGTDNSIGVLSVPNQLAVIGTFAILTTSSNGERTFRTQPMGVAQAFGGVLPDGFSILIENQLGIAFSSSGTGSTVNYLEYTPVYTTSGN